MKPLSSVAGRRLTEVWVVVVVDVVVVVPSVVVNGTAPVDCATLVPESPPMISHTTRRSRSQHRDRGDSQRYLYWSETPPSPLSGGLH